GVAQAPLVCYPHDQRLLPGKIHDDHAFIVADLLEFFFALDSLACGGLAREMLSEAKLVNIMPGFKKDEENLTLIPDQPYNAMAI
ncbi:MAG: hypothetical protein ACP5LJ_07850, partial [Candidatus Bipolaricaulaceae bacterium]